MTYIVTTPYIPGKHFKVEAQDVTWAVVNALRPSVCTEAQWEDTLKLLDKSDFKFESEEIKV